jgi:hypothetical protein
MYRKNCIMDNKGEGHSQILYLYYVLTPSMNYEKEDICNIY